jgi:hypothetical protein
MQQYNQWLMSHLDDKNVIRAKSVSADWVYAGNIQANQIDVANGKIQAAQIEELVVGGNVQMGPSATISWGNVTNQPFIPATAADVGARPNDWMPTASDVGALPWNTYIPVLPSYIKSTYIDQNNVISPFISGGVITGALFRTAASGQKLEMNSSGVISYDSEGTKTGVSFGVGTYAFSSLDYYHYGVKVASIEYNGLGKASIYPTGGAELHVFDVIAEGAWDFSQCTSLTGVDQIKAVFG